MDTTKEQELIALHDRIAEANDNLDMLKARRAELVEQILDAWGEAGLDRVHVNGRTVYLRTDRYAKVEDKQAAIKLLKLSSLGRGIVQETYNSNTLSALVRELLDERGGLPVTWEGVISYSEKSDVRVLKS